MGRLFKDFDTGTVWTEDEIHDYYEKFKSEMEKKFETFEDYMEHLLDNGLRRVGGLIEIVH